VPEGALSLVTEEGLFAADAAGAVPLAPSRYDRLVREDMKAAGGDWRFGGGRGGVASRGRVVYRGVQSVVYRGVQGQGAGLPVASLRAEEEEEEESGEWSVADLLGVNAEQHDEKLRALGVDVGLRDRSGEEEHSGFSSGFSGATPPQPFVAPSFEDWQRSLRAEQEQAQARELDGTSLSTPP
jgi:hypothetical protein